MSAPIGHTLEHTPGPWAHRNGRIFPAKNESETIAIVARASAADPLLVNSAILAAAPELLAALKDMLSGWRYIRAFHGDLPGVGWDRAQFAAESAIAKATSAPTSNGTDRK